MVALIVGAPAYADDVELMLSNPNSGGADKPNILFILDSSGSMATIERTQEPYNAATPYGGSCSSSYVYWSTDDDPPSCSTSRRISKENFVCEFGKQQMEAAGRYSDQMAMYRRDRFWFWWGPWKWQNLARGEDRLVECATDSGQHGDGTAGEVYARIGSDVSEFTSSSNSEVDWGSPPTEEVITVFSSNYMNWYHNSPVTEMSRTDIVKTVTKNVLGSIQNANIGMMHFNFSQGGVVNFAIKDLDSNRAAINSEVDALRAEDWTPLSETMYEAARYWRGMTPVYGGLDTDPDALEGGLLSTSYKAPQDFACAKNFVVFLTDGEPTQDLDAYDRVPELPDFGELGRSNCTGGDTHGACLDDVAEYLQTVDINTSLPGEQKVTTYTIGFSVDLPILEETARKGGGEYYLASDVKSLTDALTEIITNIFDRDISFTAPAVSVNAFNRTQHLNDLYISVFRAKNKSHWPGNLKKFRIADGVITDKNQNPAVDPATGYFADTAHSYWTDGGDPDGANVSLGGAASQLPDPSNRRLFTNIAGNDLTAVGNAISQTNADSFTQDDFGLTGAAGDPTVAQVIDWARGVDVRDADNDPTTTERKAMGDTLHSQPASVVYGDDNGELDIVVFTATNDGYVHAIDAATGQELWSFVPAELLSNFGKLYQDVPVNYKNYGIDGDLVPIVADRNNNGTIDVGTDFVYLVFGMRRGGNNYYALDVTDKNNPQIKWIQSFPQMGQSWSPAVVAKVDAPSVNADKAVILVGAGYDTAHDQAAMSTEPDGEGAGIFMLDLHSGAELWRAGRDLGADLVLDDANDAGDMRRAIPSRIRVLDLSGDGFADRMYAVDIGGQLWRFDIHNGREVSKLATGGVIARLGPEGMQSEPTPADTRRFYVAPDVSLFFDDYTGNRYLAVSLGSGYRSHPLDKTANDRFYSFRDPMVFTPMTQTQYENYTVAYDDDFAEVRGKSDVNIGINDRGWKYTLPAGEKVLAESVTFDDSIYFVSFEPEVASADPCQAGLSVNRLYRVNVRNGDPVVPLDTLDPNDPDAADKARVTELEQGGIAPKPMFLFPSPDDQDCEGEDCAPPPPPLGCVGVECFDPGYANNPVRTLWTQDGVD